jgi:shikimate dehydrogenase
MKKACVIGWPIEHSRSPLIHGYWLKHYGIDGTYTKEAVKPENLASFLQTLNAKGLSGCNVTVPHKEAACALADRREASALAVGAANTLWLEGDKLVAANTDTYGFMTYLESRYPDWLQANRPVSILGAGGAARAIVYGFLEAGAPEVRIFNRTQERAQSISDHFGSRVRALDWDRRSEGSRDAGVLVNATAAGMKGASTIDIDFAGLDRICIVSDIVYVPLETEFLKSARTHGLRVLDGLGMLLHQAAPGFEKWFGVRPEVTKELYDLIVADIEKH